MRATIFTKPMREITNRLVFLSVGILVILIPSYGSLLPSNTKVQALVVKSGGKAIFAGTDNKGIFLSTNNGSTWTVVDSGLPDSTNILSLLVSGGNVFAGTEGKGVFLSTNNGAFWTAANNGWPATTTVLSLASSGGTIFAGTEGKGIFLSTNNGANWKAVNNGQLSIASISSFAVSGGNIFAGTNGRGIFLSTNNGTGWTAVNNSGLPGTTNVLSLAVNGGGAIFAGTEARGVLLSTNNGGNWTAVTGLSSSASVPCLAVNRGLIFAGIAGQGVFLSKDDGTTWKPYYSDQVEITVLSIAVSDSTVFMGFFQGWGLVRKYLAIIVSFTKLKMQQSYDCPVNYYHFTLEGANNAVSYDLYGNDALLLHTSDRNSLNGLIATSVIDSIGIKTGRLPEFGDTIIFSIVARSNDGQIAGISNYVYYQYEMYVGAHTPRTLQQSSGIRISGSSIDCSSLEGMVRIALYSLNGEKVWEKEGIGVKTMVPAYLPRGIYTMELSGSFGKARSVILKK